MGRYSHSKMETFKQCPKKYDYNYVQDLNPIEESIHLTVGKLFHGVMDALSKEEDPTPFYEEFAALVRSGMLPSCAKDTLEITVEEFLNFYYDVDADTETIFTEKKFEHLTDDMNVISGMFDKVYTRFGNVYLKDYKTTINKLKYKLKDVNVNSQLYLYHFVLENDFNIIPQFIEIDEVCIHPLNGVELCKDGTPTTDTRKLAWTTYDTYYNVLVDLGLEHDPKYENILSFFKERGHPLFRRITVPVNQLTRQNVYEECAALIKMIEVSEPYRVKGPLCDYCAYHEICHLELQGGSSSLVDEMKRKFFKKSE